jgi:hypothetical protein
LGKLNTERGVPLDDSTLTVLDQWMSQRGPQRALPHPRTGRPADFLFTLRGARIGASRIRKGLDDSVLAAGLVRADGQPQHVTPHQLRHTYATELVNAGMSLQALLGHVTPETTTRYAHLADTTVRNSYDLAMARVRETRQLPLVVSDRPIFPERIEWLRSEMIKTRVAHGYCSRHLAADACPTPISASHATTTPPALNSSRRSRSSSTTKPRSGTTQSPAAGTAKSPDTHASSPASSTTSTDYETDADLLSGLPHNRGPVKQGAFEFLFPAPAGVLAADGRAGAAGDRCDAGIGREVGCAGEVLAGHFGQDAGADPDTDARHRGQDPMKRLDLHRRLDPGGDVVSLAGQAQQLLREFREDFPGRAGADDQDGLLPERGEDGVREAFRGAGCVLLQPCFDVYAAGVLQRGRRRMPGQQVGHGKVGQMRAQGPFLGLVDLGEQPADRVGPSRDLRGGVVIESAEHTQFGQRIIVQGNGPQHVRHGPGGLGDDRRVPRIGRGLSRVQVRSPSHRQARRVPDDRSGCLGDRDRQGADGGRLVHDEQDFSVPGQAGEDLPEPVSSLGSALSKSSLAARSKATAW